MNKLQKLQRIHAFICICFLGGVTVVKPANFTLTTAFDPVAVLLQILAFGPMVIFGMIRWRLVKRHLRFLTSPLPLPLLAIVSTVWSVDPPFTLRRSIVFFTATLLAYYIGVTFNPARLVGLYRSALLFMIAASLTIVALLPSYGISHGANGAEWTGSFFHKNRLGEMMALAVITFVVAPTARFSGRARLLISAAALLLLYKSHAGTAISGVAIVIVAQGIWILLQQRRKTMATILLIGYPILAVAIGLVVNYSSSLFALLGKDATLTGRTFLWVGVVHAIKQRPLLGYGYLAFWQQKGGVPLLVAELTSFAAPHAHDGYLDVMIHLGLLGLVLFLQFYFRGLWLSIAEGRRTRSPEARWFFSFVIFMAATNFTESQILEPFFFLWATLVALYTSFSVQRSRRYDRVEAEEEEEVADQSSLISAAS